MALITLDRALQQIPQAKECDYPVITALISACSDVVETYCQRTFTQQTWDELHSFDRATPFLFVNNPPIQSINWIRTGRVPACYVQYQDSTNQTQQATVEVTSSAVVLKTIYNNVVTTNTLTFASYPTFADLQTAINGVSGWVCTLNGQYAKWQTSDMVPQGTFGARNMTASLTVYWYYLNSFKYETSELGQITSIGGFLPGTQTYRVSYVGGYSTIPEDLQQAVAELVQQTFALVRLTNPLMQSETIDKYSYTRTATTTLDQLSFTAKQTLRNYRRLQVSRQRS